MTKAYLPRINILWYLDLLEADFMEGGHHPGLHGRGAEDAHRPLRGLGDEALAQVTEGQLPPKLVNSHVLVTAHLLHQRRQRGELHPLQSGVNILQKRPERGRSIMQDFDN